MTPRQSRANLEWRGGRQIAPRRHSRHGRFADRLDWNGPLRSRSPTPVASYPGACTTTSTPRKRSSSRSLNGTEPNSTLSRRTHDRLEARPTSFRGGQPARAGKRPPGAPAPAAVRLAVCQPRPGTPAAEFPGTSRSRSRPPCWPRRSNCSSRVAERRTAVRHRPRDVRRFCQAMLHLDLGAFSNSWPVAMRCQRSDAASSWTASSVASRPGRSTITKVARRADRILGACRKRTRRTRCGPPAIRRSLDYGRGL